MIESYRVSAAGVPPTHREPQRARPCEYDVRYFLVCSPSIIRSFPQCPYGKSYPLLVTATVSVTLRVEKARVPDEARAGGQGTVALHRESEGRAVATGGAP